MSSPWNHGKISRNAAEQLLVANGKNGAFLVRQSESVNDAHVLSLWFDGMVHHFRILRKENMFVVQGAGGSVIRMFTTLEEVIELFKQPGQGLPHVLVEPISNIVNEMEHDSDDEPDQEKDVVDGRMEPVEECMDISIQLINRLAQMDYSGLGNDFCSKVQCYLNGGFDRDGKRMNGSEPATDLQDLVVNCAEGVKRELKEFLKKIVFLQELFCTDDDFKKLVPGAGLSSGHSARQSNDVSPYDDLVQDLAICVAGIKSLEMLAHKSYQEQAGFMKDEQSQTRTFEVTSCGNFKTRSYLKVDIIEGKLLIMKNENDSINDSTVVEHDKILQFIKDPSTPKLTLKIAKGNREYLFKDIQAREYLCQLVQYMMSTHDPNKKEPKQISIFVGTWNMGSASPRNIESWLKCEGTGEEIDSLTVKLMGHDIYAIGTQESSVNETSWVSKIKMALKSHWIAEYKTVAVYSLWGIRLVILAKVEHTNRISRIEKSCVKTGIANTLGNKGGVGISFDFLSTSLCFINCHLTSGNEDLRKQRRQQNYMDILKGLNLGHKSAYDLTNQFHHVFWFGDLNYRIDMQYEEIIKAVKDMDYKLLADNDQLKKEQELGNVFVNFHENAPQFPPTYRYKRGTRESYEHIKVKRAAVNRINVPSWCDRVLWRSFPDLTVEQKSYGCTDDIVTSDHSPVFASFDVQIKSQIGASPDKERPNLQANKPLCKIHIPFIKVKIKTVSKTDFYLEFHSVCLVTSVRSDPGKQSSPWDPPRTVNSKPTLTSYLEWADSSSLPELNPIFDNPDYLREQHILIAVKSENGDESYGECVVSLKGHLFNTPQKFESDLTHGGIKAGEIRGRMNILNAKQAAVLKRPPVQAMSDLGAKPASQRPLSCVTPNVNKIMPTPMNKSTSLGRPPAVAPRGYSAQPPQNTSQISTYMEIRDLSPTNESDNPLYQATTTLSSERPPLPPKKYPSKTLPSTVDEFLSKIGLQGYLSNLCDNGFDNIIFLDEISDEDLADSGITDMGHIQKILNEVEYLRKAGAFNS